MLRNPPFYPFASFLIVLLAPFINKPVFSIYFTIFMKSSVSSFEVINVVIPDLEISLGFPAFAAGAAAVNLNGIKTISTNGLDNFPLN